MFDCVKKFVKSLCGESCAAMNREPRVVGKDVHGIDSKLVSWQAKRTCEALQAHGYEAYVVGGAVRDLLLGVAPKDFDVATNATPEQVKRSVRRAFIIGRRFRIVHVMFGAEVVECSTFRALDAKGVRKDNQGRVISDNVFGPMWEDAARRDFTINALYYDPTTELVYDYHDGLRDIRKKRLKMIGDPVERYREDPVRMMRAVRIAGKLGFKIDPATQKPIARMAGLLRTVPDARLFGEMMKLFTSVNAVACLSGMRANKLLHPLMPVLDVVLGEPQGEELLMLAMKRTDERIRIGKKISPAFMFATLLWPQVKKRWEAYEKKPGLQRAAALFEASEDVVSEQCERLAIQNRFIVDMKIIWMLQIRFERRTGKNPYTLIEHPKYRAGYDFMLLRSQLGHVPAEQVQWWERFVACDEAERETMVLAQERACRGSSRKRFVAVKKSETTDAEVNQTIEAIEATRKPRRRRRRHAEGSATVEANEKRIQTPTGETLIQVETRERPTEEGAKPTRRPRRRRAPAEA